MGDYKFLLTCNFALPVGKLPYYIPSSLQRRALCVCGAITKSTFLEVIQNDGQTSYYNYFGDEYNIMI